ncbi:alpha/beta hydrolase family protein [Leptospira fainei serovar Hurstbridge str. BUT 6]|uniref:Alpha/beta hydrolase family protein n=1 Tax=Leptospira fainei serovar Hurstbridge str. BUT 6 TaxID=1193011 RepID=S3VFF7_9LEPT|nr:alpha/beta hydrolase [Leptospira fainei]EPG75225.1 alpha/beta hydrolase family protein [Leptospira fainei serovar Hurstbridge str. BUT 6]
MKEWSVLKKFSVILSCLALLFVLLSTIGLFRIPETTGTDPNLPRTSINGYPFYTEKYGNPKNPLIIVLHGGPGSDFQYLKELKRLSDEYHVLFYDQRGSGRSARNDHMSFAIESFLEDLGGMIRIHSNGKKAILIGHSWGGMLATAYISRFPNEIDEAVIMEPGMLNQKTAVEFLTKVKQVQTNLGLSKMAEIALIFSKSIFVKSKDGHEMKDYILTKMMGMGKGQPYQCEGESLPEGAFVRAGYLAFSKTIFPLMDDPKKFNYNLAEGIKSFKGKILLLSSECSFIGFNYQRENHESLFPPATTHLLIPGTGHNMITLKPDESIRKIRDFLKK